MKKKIVIKSSKNNSAENRKVYVRAAENDPEDNMNIPEGDGSESFDETDGIMDAMDDIAENVEDLQDTIDDMEEDDVEISINNNIADHYIAECDRCGGVFISAVVDSDQNIESVSGTCPLCGRDTEQHLKWIIKSVND